MYITKYLQFIIILFFTFQAPSLAETNFNKLDIVKIQKKQNTDYIAKKNQKVQYAIVLSNAKYNAQHKKVIVASVYKKGKRYKPQTLNQIIKINNQEYVIYSDKIRILPKAKLNKSFIFLNIKERNQLENKFNSIFK